MKHSSRFPLLLSAACAVCAVVPRLAYGGDELPTVIAERGPLIVKEDFAKPFSIPTGIKFDHLPSGWGIYAGKWENVGQAIRATELAEQHHGAVLVYSLPFRDGLFQVDIRLEGARNAALVVNAAKHVARATLTKSGLTVQKDARGPDGKDHPTVFGHIPLGQAEGSWETVLLEIKGDAMAGSMDGKSVSGTHPDLVMEKTNVSFVVWGGSASFRNFRAWQATAKGMPSQP